MAPRPRRSPADRIADLVTSGLLLAGFGFALAGMYRVLEGIGWWWQSFAVVAITLGVAAGVRALTRHPAWGSLAGAAAAFLTIVVMFVPDKAFLFLIPTGDTIAALRDLEQAGLTSIAEQNVPATPDAGIVFLVCIGVAAAAVLADLLAIGVRMPALAAIPLGILVLVPSLVRPAFSDALIFALVAAVFVALLLVRAKRLGWRGTAGLAGTAIVAALVAPVVLPPVIPSEGNTGGSGITTGLNPILDLGNDLRRAESQVVLTYTTTGPGVYLRLAVLDDLTGVAWRPTMVEPVAANTVDEIPDPPGLTDDVPRLEVVTDVQVGNVLSRWLPVPYSPKSVEGLEGTWTWEADGFAIRSARSNARNQVYSVTSLSVQPSVEQLLASGVEVAAGLDRYLVVPEDLPAVVGRTAEEVVAGAATSFERAVALQEFFTGGAFTYSEEAPVEDRYDGSGASVLAPFLERRAGYCVHFASAMAAMARTLGIPARMVVGFTPGTWSEDADSGLITWTVTTHDMHAWPELFFADIGWVRFEPTPGRGEVPAFAQATEDDPDTPDVDESVPTPRPTATDLPSNTPAPVGPDVPTDEPDAGSAGDAGAGGGGGFPWAGPLTLAGLVLVLLVPFMVRTARRGRRLTAVDDGSAQTAWAEIRDTAIDLGWGVDPGQTARQFADDLGGVLDDEGSRLLDRLRGDLELELYADRAAQPSSEDLAGVLRGMRRAAGAGRGLVAMFAPRSLLPARWQPGADQVSGRNAITGRPSTSSTVASTP